MSARWSRRREPSSEGWKEEAVVNQRAIGVATALSLAVACAAPGGRALAAGPPVRGEVDAATVAAFERRGAEYGALTAAEDGKVTFAPRRSGAGAGGLPAFRFEDATDAKLAGLPRPSVPFGLILSSVGHRIIGPGPDVGDAGLRHLVAFEQLQWLDLSYTKVTDEGLQQLKPLTRLRSLDLSATRVGDEGLRHLTAFQQLQRLNLTYTKVSDEGLRHLATCKALQRLNLAYTKVGDEGLRHLAACKNSTG